MSNKSVAIGTVIVLVSIVAIALATETYLTLQAVNPVAAVAAVTVALIGFAWLRRTAKH